MAKLSYREHSLRVRRLQQVQSPPVASPPPSPPPEGYSTTGFQPGTSGMHSVLKICVHGSFL